MIPVKMVYPHGPVAGVYTILDRDGRVRIGYSEDCQRRKDEHQSSNGRELRLFAILWGATLADEACLHHKLLRWRISGRTSWYYNTTPLWREILTYVRCQEIELIMIGRDQLDLFRY